MVYLQRSHCRLAAFEILLILTMGVFPMASSTLDMIPISCFLGICIEWGPWVIEERSWTGRVSSFLHVQRLVRSGLTKV